MLVLIKKRKHCHLFYWWTKVGVSRRRRISSRSRMRAHGCFEIPMGNTCPSEGRPSFSGEAGYAVKRFQEWFGAEPSHRRRRSLRAGIEPAGLVRYVIWTPDVPRCSHIMGGEPAGLVLHMMHAPDVLRCSCFEILMGASTIGASWVVRHRIMGDGPPAPKNWIFEKKR